MRNACFPFSAIVGQEQAKAALVFGLINPKIGGVLLCGQKGCAKSTMVRAVGSLLQDVDVVELPLNVTEDMLIGTIDIERAIKYGARYFNGGVLERANGNVLYVDEVNLLSDTVVNSLLDVAQSGVNRVEREGISFVHESEFLLVGSMNPEEAPLRPEFLDRFGLYVQMKGIGDFVLRKRIVQQRLAYEQNPTAFYAKYIEADRELARQIAEAKSRVPDVKAGESVLGYAAELANTVNAAGHRADIIMIETALAIAALDKRDEVEREDVETAAEYVLPHRIRQSLCPDEETKPEPQRQQSMDEQNDVQENRQGDTENAAQPQMQFDNQPNGTEERNMPIDNDIEDDPVVSGSDVYTVKNIAPMRKDKNKRRGSGRRSKTVSGTNKGRYIGHTQTSDVFDIALDATLRAAAVYQSSREKTVTALNVQKSDLRFKKREHHTGTTILFVVDASGSMGARRRMVQTKEAILSLLYDAYQKRDRVGMIAFRKQAADIVLPFTRSIDLAQKRLQKLPTGGRTPLGQGLLLAWQMIKTQQTKDEDTIPLLILITDGRANDTLSDDPIGSALKAAQAIFHDRIQSVVIDTENGSVNLGIAEQIAENMNAQYIKVDDLKAQAVAHVVRAANFNSKAGGV